MIEEVPRGWRGNTDAEKGEWYGDGYFEEAAGEYRGGYDWE